mgnify:CR=1 FL=1
MNSEEPEDEMPNHVADVGAAYERRLDKDEDMSLDDIKLIEHAARILQTNGDTAAALRRAMLESIAANESDPPRLLGSERDSAIGTAPNGVDVLSMDPDDDIEFEPPRLAGRARPARLV